VSVAAFRRDGRRRRAAAFATSVAAVSVVAGLTAGCGNGTSITTPFVTAPVVLQHGPEYEVKTGSVSGLGTVLIDGKGITVYMYATDKQGRPSRCYDICAVEWPPLVLPPGVTRPVAGPGIESALLGTAPRSDGTTQITYNGWPLYLWPPDRAPGMATGQALTNAGGLWYVLDRAGKPIVTASS
jgi:predicted lipoprotein with Yx(FWY)xxD motif